MSLILPSLLRVPFFLLLVFLPLPTLPMQVLLFLSRQALLLLPLLTVLLLLLPNLALPILLMQIMLHLPVIVRI